ncbi:hypothetical protein [Marinobacter sp. C2H3]|uniref:hypothetical protein n=1 Tax=Marinobacter sp. C2H3 TaxID=3119003 RepID=UPI00300F4C4A
MTTLALERGWLLDPNHLKLVHRCRRLIQSEFGVKLHLTEQHLAQRLAEFAGKTRSPHLSRTWDDLVARVPELGGLANDDAEDDAPKRRYRGQVIADPELPAPGEAAPDVPARKTAVIYRGQVVSP